MNKTITITVKAARMQIATKMIAGMYTDNQLEALEPLVKKLNHMQSNEYIDVEVTI